MSSKAEIEEKLRQFLGAEKVLWLPRGIYNDETNEHVDNVCAFIRPGEVVLVNSKAQSLVSSSVSTSKDSAKTLASIESESEDMVKSAQALYKNSRKDDTDATYKKVSAFVSDYNSLINAADDSETKQISRNLESMKSLTDINSKSLAKVGITVDSKSGKLSVDEDTFKKADSTKVDALFKGNGSYAYAVASKASMLEYAAKNEAEKTNTYGANGRYTQAYNSGYNYNMFL